MRTLQRIALGMALTSPKEMREKILAISQYAWDSECLRWHLAISKGANEVIALLQQLGLPCVPGERPTEVILAHMAKRGLHEQHKRWADQIHDASRLCKTGEFLELVEKLRCQHVK